MNVLFAPNAFTLLLKSQFIFIEHILYARHFTISPVAFKGIASGLCLSAYLIILLADVPRYHPLFHSVRPWDLQLEKLGSSSSCAICYLCKFGQSAQAVLFIHQL